MIFSKSVLIATGLVFLALGLGFLWSPDGMATLIAIPISSGRELTEIRAMYGGLEAGLGIFFLVAAFRERWIRAALAAQFLVLGGLGTGRLLGILTGVGGGSMPWFALVEAAGAAGGVAAFMAVKRILIEGRPDPRSGDPDD